MSLFSKYHSDYVLLSETGVMSFDLFVDAASDFLRNSPEEDLRRAFKVNVSLYRTSQCYFIRACHTLTVINYVCISIQYCLGTGH